MLKASKGIFIDTKISAKLKKKPRLSRKEHGEYDDIRFVPF